MREDGEGGSSGEDPGDDPGARRPAHLVCQLTFGGKGGGDEALVIWPGASGLYIKSSDLQRRSEDFLVRPAPVFILEPGGEGKPIVL